MKVLILISLVVFSSVALAEMEKEGVAIQAEKKNAFKGLFYSVWNKFKTMSPKNKNVVRKSTVTMGVRGAQTTSTILQPYWKDDKTSDKKFMQQLEDFAQAQNMADKGEMTSANKAFKDFIVDYPESDLRPNAQFAEAMTMGAMGALAQSSQSFNDFISENPRHPLVKDAEMVIKELNQ